jgi:hypothetical protein
LFENATDVALLERDVDHRRVLRDLATRLEGGPFKAA